jgi:SIR2-like domain
MDENEWTQLIKAIREGRCTPFLGAGASHPLPRAAELARELASQFHLLVGADGALPLPQVAQYVSLLDGVDEEDVRRFIKEYCAQRGTPDFDSPRQIHRVLAGLPLPIYVTTNYDNFMALALEHAGKDSVVERCQWYRRGEDTSSNTHDTVVDSRAQQSNLRAANATSRHPLVFHLHGTFDDYSSMVLTEDDYLDFLSRTSVLKWLVPPNIEMAFADTRLLFLGYSLDDMTFKVLLRRISATVRRLERVHLTVQIPLVNTDNDEADRQRIAIRVAYVKQLLGSKAKVYWGSCEDFAVELGRRWKSPL